MNINSILTIASLVVFAVAIIILYQKSKNETVKIEVQNYNTFDKVLEGVKNEMVEIVRQDITMGLSDSEFERLYRRKARVNGALKNCVYGIDTDKILVIDLIRSFIAKNVPPENVTSLLGLNPEGEPSNHIKFEILMYRYKKEFGKDALVKWIRKYGFDRERKATGADRSQDMAYYITEEDLNMSYANENIKLNIEEQIDVLAILVYQQYKGFGIVDTLREMNINGFNMGTSGSILSATNKDQRVDFKADRAVWLYESGKYIHLRFMSFGNEEELRRIIQLLIRWGNPGPLTSKRGYLVNTMFDKSRILALRPPASEYWAIFVRKFTLNDVSPQALIIKEYTHRGDLAIQLLELIMRGQVTAAVTGRQGSGKTTLMTSIIRYIDPRYTIRVLEMAPELYLRELYPTRNILSVQETNTVSAAELQDALKKSDAAVSIVGEVATDSIAARMIQMGMTASIFTIFSHHANTPKDLVLTLRNSLVNDGGFSNMETAEKQVTDVVKLDVHLDYTADGKRYIERISEIIQLDEGIPYPQYDENDPTNSMNKIRTEFYQRSTDRVGFTTHDILRYDLETHTYYTVDRFSPKLEKKIRAALGNDLVHIFDEFMLREWGPRKDENGNPTMTDKEVKAKLVELQDKISGLKFADSEQELTFKAKDGELLNEKSAKEIKEEADEKAEWASAYSDDSSDGQQPYTLGEFGMDDLFNDEDYV